jgi:hypothetical protein
MVRNTGQRLFVDNEIQITNFDQFVQSTKKQLSTNDVQVGRGAGGNRHAGNEAYRLLVEECAPFYPFYPDGQKGKLAEEIVAAVHKCGGKFYEKKKGEVGWQEVPDKRAWDKAQALLRAYASKLPPATPPPLTTKKPTVHITPERPSVLSTTHHRHLVSASSSPASPRIVPCLAHHAVVGSKPSTTAAWTSVEEEDDPDMIAAFLRDIDIMPYDEYFSPEFLARLCNDEDDHCDGPAALVQQQQLSVLSPPSPLMLTPRLSSSSSAVDDVPLLDNWLYDALLGNEWDMAVCDGGTNNDDDSTSWSF